MKFRFLIISLGLLITFNIFSNNETEIYKKVLENGLTVIVKPTHHVPEVAIQMWYNVGSKDEETSEKGLAHLLEHMIFKGTNKISESDIGALTSKLSGYCNAHTSYDHTAYVFTLPSRHWQEALPVLADCMQNCTFKQDLLNAEFKAVIQELKMYRDNFVSMLTQELLGCIFPDHPYHFPVIGFKQDIWKINSEALHKFYKKHYLPNNATLVIVGDVDVKDAFSATEQFFSKIPANNNYKKSDFYLNSDISQKTVTLYRDTKMPIGEVLFVIPGIKDIYTNQAASVIIDALTNGISSRLYKKLVEDLQLVNWISGGIWDLFDHSIAIICFEPKNINDMKKVINIIKDEISELTKNGISDKELKRIANQTKAQKISLLENNYEQAGLIGQYYLATKNEKIIFELLDQDILTLKDKIQYLLTNYFRPSIMHKGYLLPISDDEKIRLNELQEKYDREDAKVLAEHIRESDVEPCKYALSVQPKPINQYNFPIPQTFELKNGSTVLYHNHTNIPSITISIKLKPEYYYEEIPGIYKFLTSLLGKTTKNFKSNELFDEIETLGMSLNINLSNISLTCFSHDINKALEILTEILTQTTFDDNEIEKVRSLMLADLNSFYENPNSILSQLISETIYKNHPYEKNALGTEKSIKKITKKDLEDAYKKLIIPKGAIISIVGELDGNIKSKLEQTLEKWTGPDLQEINYPELSPIKYSEIDYYLNKDQIVIGFAGLSIKYNDPDYRKLLIFNHILSGYMSSKLFELREKTGLFYTIHGDLVSHAGKQPGFSKIFAIVSRENLKEATEVIKTCIKNIVETITEEEIQEAKNNLIDSLVTNYSKNQHIANTFIHLKYFDLPFDFYNNYVEKIKDLTLDEVKEAARKVLNIENMALFKVGRVNK